MLPFLEHYITLPLTKKYIKFLMLLVISNIFCDNVKYTKHARNIVIILFEFRKKKRFYSIII